MRCFTNGVLPGASAKLSRLAAVATCADEWTGSASHLLPGFERSDAQVTWQLDPTFDGAPVQVGYLATGTLTWHHLFFEGQGCTRSPTTFAIGGAGAQETSCSRAVTIRPTASPHGEECHAPQRS